MGLSTKIQWTNYTWNPFWGCEKVSQGCKFCYAERIIQGRFGQKFREVRTTKPATFRLPYKIHKKLTGAEPFTERLVFTCSMSDFFIAQGDADRPELWKIIRETPNLIYQILTKRPERIKAQLPDDWGPGGYPNVWLGVSAEDQEVFDERVQVLNTIPATVRFVSIEPILKPVRLTLPIDWAIVGGESGGPGAFRPSTLSWYEDLVDDGNRYEVPIFIKQFGTFLAGEKGLTDKVGGDIEEFPSRLQVRQFPKPRT